MLTSITNTNNIASRSISFKESDAAKNLYEQIGQVDEEFKQKQAAQAQKISKRKKFIKNNEQLLIAGLMAICTAFGYFIHSSLVSDKNNTIENLNGSIDSKKNELDSLNTALVANYDEYEKETAQMKHQTDSLNSILTAKQKEIQGIVDRENALNKRDSVLNVQKTELSTKEKELSTREKTLKTEEQNLENRKKQLDKREQELNKRENNIKAKENKGSKTVTETNTPQKSGTARKVNKVLNTGEYGNLSHEALVSILNNQHGEVRFRYKNGELQHKSPFWYTLKEQPKTRLKKNESTHLPMHCHDGDRITVGRTNDGFYWAENYCGFGRRGEFYHLYTESGQPISQQQRVGLYRTNVLATLQRTDQFNTINTNLFASVLASMGVLDIDADDSKNCIYCKTNGGQGLKITYNVKDKNIDGNIEYYSSFDEAKFSSKSSKTSKFTYKVDENNSSIAVFTQSDKEQIFKAEKGAIYKNGTKIIE